MIIANTSGVNFILRYGTNNLKLSAGSVVDIKNSIYLGNSEFKNQVDSLVRRGMVSISGVEENLPIEANEEQDNDIIPFNFEISEGDLIVYIKGGLAALSVNEVSSDIQGNETFYGFLVLESNKGSKIILSASEDDRLDGMLLLDKLNDNISHFDIRQNGAKLTLDPSSVSAEDIANFLIDLGLAESE